MGLDGFWAFGSLALPPCLPPLLPPDAHHHPECDLVTLAQVISAITAALVYLLVPAAS
jgi:hypothetical protein